MTSTRNLINRSVLGLALVTGLAMPAHAGVIDDAVVYYDFEGTGQTVADQSGTPKIDLTLGANGAVSSDDPDRTAGKFGNGLTFVSGDVVSSGSDENALDFNADDPFSVAGWFRRDDARGVSQKFLLSKMDPSGPFPGWFLTWRDSGISSGPDALNFFMRDNQDTTSDGGCTSKE